jgi:hypothetical protein
MSFISLKSQMIPLEFKIRLVDNQLKNDSF